MNGKFDKWASENPMTADEIGASEALDAMGRTQADNLSLRLTLARVEAWMAGHSDGGHEMYSAPLHNRVKEILKSCGGGS